MQKSVLETFRGKDPPTKISALALLRQMLFHFWEWGIMGLIADHILMGVCLSG